MMLMRPGASRRPGRILEYVGRSACGAAALDAAGEKKTAQME